MFTTKLTVNYVTDVGWYGSDADCNINIFTCMKGDKVNIEARGTWYCK